MSRTLTVLSTTATILTIAATYRFVGRDLVLFDTHADLVIDILSNALPVN